MSVQSIELNQKLVIVAIGAEVCWEYAELVRRKFPDSAVWPLGYTDAVFGYLPTSPMLAEGGYETSGFMRPFGIHGKFVPDVDEVVLAGLNQLRP